MSVMVMMGMLIIIVLPTVAKKVVPAFVSIMKTLVPMLHRMSLDQRMPVIQRLNILSFLPKLSIVMRIHDLSVRYCFRCFLN